MNTVFEMVTSFPGSLKPEQDANFAPLYDACSITNISRGVLGTRVNPDMCRVRVDGQIQFEYGYAWTWTFLNPERKSCGFINIRIRVDGA